MAVLEGADKKTAQVFQRLREHRPDGPIAQLDRVTDFYSVGCRFESCWDRQIKSAKFSFHELGICRDVFTSEFGLLRKSTSPRRGEVY